MQDQLPVADDTKTGRWRLKPVRSREPWVLIGLLVQAVGLGSVTAFLWVHLHHQDAGGHITAAMFQLVWHSEVHARTGLAVLLTGGVIYVAGSILLARPYVSRPVTLLIGVPIAAIIGMVMLGIIALILAIIFSGLLNFLQFILELGDGEDRKTRKARKAQRKMDKKARKAQRKMAKKAKKAQRKMARKRR